MGLSWRWGMELWIPKESEFSYPAGTPAFSRFSGIQHGNADPSRTVFRI